MDTDEPLDVQGKRIVFAGAMSMSRAALQAQLEARGATVETTVSRVTDLVVQGDGGAPTLFAARDKGVPVVAEARLLAALGIDAGAAAPGEDAGPPIDPAELQGAQVVITGQLAGVDRQEAAQRLALLGAQVVSDVTPETRVLFAGEKAGTKLFQAREHGVRVADEGALLAVLAQAPALAEVSEQDRRAAEQRAARAKAAEVMATLQGAEVVIAGTLRQLDRANVVKRLTHFGARTADRVTRSTKLLVAGEAKGPNFFLAKQQRTPIVDEAVLALIFEQLPRAPDESELAREGAGAPSDGPPVVAGKRVLIAGTLTRVDRVRAKRGLERAGAEVVTRMDESVQLVIAGENGGRSLFLAKELGVPLLTEDGLLALLERAAAEHPERDSDDQAPPELRGARVVLAGVFESLGRVEAKRALARLGAEVVDQVDETVQCVVAGERGGRNLLLARMLKIPTLDEPALRTILEREGALAAPGDDRGSAPPELRGARVLLAGTLERLGRPEARRGLERLGAEVVDQLDPTVTWVVAGAKGGRNLLLAKQLGVPLLAEATLLAALEAGGALGADGAEQQPPRAVDLTGAVVAITGRLTGLDRQAVAERLATRGVQVARGVAPQVQYLIVGEGANPSQRVLARKLKIPEVGEAELSRFLGE